MKKPDPLLIKMLLYFFLFIPAFLWVLVKVVTWNACMTESRLTIPDVLGYQIEVSDTNCDLLAKDDAVSVFASKPGSWKRTLLVKYVAYGYDDLPQITANDQGGIEISLGEIADLYSKQENLDGIRVNYKLEITHPSESKLKGEK